MTQLSFEDYSFKYALGDDYALRKINFEINQGEIIAICGKSGCGKTTLLKSLKNSIKPVGEVSGIIRSDISDSDIAIVFQNPEVQIVMNTVISNLSFQMENLGLSSEVMKKRMAETVSFFGLNSILNMEVSKLSGGQKQIVILCAAMMTYPKVLLLDEPLSQLDPIARKEFIETLKRINSEFGITIVISEHRLDDTIQIVDTLAFMNNGKVVCSGPLKKTIKEMYLTEDEAVTSFIPDVPKLSLKLKLDDVYISPGEFITGAQKHFTPTKIKNSDAASNGVNCKVLCLNNIVFKYKDREEFVLDKLTMDIKCGEKISLIGGNGSGKTTLIKMITDILKPQMGKIKRNYQSIGYLPQHSDTFFAKDKIIDEVRFDKFDKNFIINIAKKMEIDHILNKHPYDISGGEMQKVAILILISEGHDLLVLDEPTKNLDPFSKKVLANIFKALDITLVMSTHDLEFAAMVSDRCFMLFNGEIAFSSTPREFLQDSNYYTTTVAKATKKLFEGAINIEDVLKVCGM